MSNLRLAKEYLGYYWNGGTEIVTVGLQSTLMKTPQTHFPRMSYLQSPICFWLQLL